VIAIRGGVYFVLLLFFMKVAILYAVAHMIMMTILRFMDRAPDDAAGSAGWRRLARRVLVRLVNELNDLTLPRTSQAELQSQLTSSRA